MRERPAPAALDPARLLAAVVPRRWWILGLAAGLTAVCWVAIRVFVPQEFRSETLIAWIGAPDARGDAAAREFRGLTDAIKLPATVAELRRRLNLTTPVAVLSSRISVSATEGSNVIRIQAAADDPTLAARMADTTVDVFLEQTLERDRQHAAVHEREMKRQLEAAREQLTAATAAYEAFRKSSGVSDLPAERKVAIEQAARLQSESELARADAESGSHDAGAGASSEGAGAAPPADSKIVPYVAKLAEVNAELATARSSLSPDHPRVQSLEAGAVALRKLKDKQEAELAGKERQRLLRKQEIYAQLAQQARDRVAELTSVEARASELLAAVHVGETLVAEAEGESIRALSAMNASTSPFRIVARANVPERALRSLRRPLAMLAPFVALLIAATVIVGPRLRGLRPLTPREVAFWGRAPVAAASTWPAEPEARGALVGDLRPLVSRAGTTLIVAAKSDALPAAAELVELLGDGAVAYPQAALAGLAGVRALRRASREATRVVVLVSAGRLTNLELRGFLDRLGRASAVAYVVLDIDLQLVDLADSAGDLTGFLASRPPIVTEVPALGVHRNG